MTIAFRTVLSAIVAGSLQASAPPASAPPASAPQTPAPNPDIHYRIGPDSYPRDGVPKGEVRGPFTLPSEAYPGTQHTYWIYVPAQYDAKVPASLMIFNDGQAFKNMDGDLRAPNVLDNLIYRREIPVMVAVFINPGRRPDQPEPTPQNWGDQDTNRPTEYNTLDDKYARVIVDELMPALDKDYNLSKDPERHAIGGASSGAIAAFTVAWQRPEAFRKVLSIVGSFTNIRGGHAYADIVRSSEKKPLRVYLQDGRNDNRGIRRGGYDETWDWFLQNNRLMRALSDKGYDLNYAWGIGRHGQKQGGAIMPDMMRWLWRDQPVSIDPNDAVERAFNEPASKTGSAPVAPPDPAIAELLALEAPWNTAHLRGDADALGALWADTLSIIVPAMPAMTKGEALALVKAGTMKFERYETSDLKVRLYGSSAIVSGRLKRTRTVDGRTVDDDWQFTKIYVRPQGKWQVAAFHASSTR
jgi:enterochelin esterase family protein